MITVANRLNIALLLALVLGLLAPSVSSPRLQQTNKIHRIDFLAFGHRPVGKIVTRPPVTAFRQSRVERGYVHHRTQSNQVLTATLSSKLSYRFAASVRACA